MTVVQKKRNLCIIFLFIIFLIIKVDLYVYGDNPGVYLDIVDNIEGSNIRKSLDKLFYTGFETGEFYPFSEPSLNRGNAEVIEGDAFCGNYFFKSQIENDIEGSRRAYMGINFTSVEDYSSRVWAKFYFKIDDTFINSMENNHAFIGSLAKTRTGPIVRFTIFRKNGQLYLGLYSNMGKVIGETPLQRDVWYCSEIGYDMNQGLITTYLNGNKENEITGLTELDIVNELRIGWDTWITNQGGTIYFDNISVSEERIPYKEQEMIIISPPSFFGRIGMKFKVFLTSVYNTDRFKVTLYGEKGYIEQVFYKDGNLEKNFDFNLDLRTLQADNYTVKIELMDTNNNILDSHIRRFTKPYDGLPVTGINENSAVCLNGEPIFFVHAYGLGRNSVPLWTERKFCNLQLGYFDMTQTPDRFTDYLNKADEANTMVIGPQKDTTWVNRSPRGTPYPNLDELTEAVEANKDHPALFFWNWMDEPISNHGGITGSVEGNMKLVRSWTEKSHELDPRHLVFTSEWATLENFDYLQSRFSYPNWVADVYSFDLYAIEFQEDSGEKLAEFAEINRRYNSYNHGLMPFSTWIETCDVRPKGRNHDTTQYPPTQEQLRMLSWISIVHGAKGISWFHYFGKTPPENYVQMSEIVRFTEEYKDVILSAGPKNIVVIDDANQLGQRVDIMVRETATDIYIFAIRVSEVAGEVYVNPLEQDDITVNFTVNGSPLSDTVVEDVFSIFKSADHQEWDVDEPGQAFNLQLDTDVEPGSVILGGGYLSSDSDVGYPTKWIYLYDDGQGNLKPEFSWQPGVGTIDYTTGVINCDFETDIDVGEDKIHAGFTPKSTEARNLNMVNGQFSDVFERCELHVYRIPKSNESIPPTITRHPTTKSTMPGGEVTFSVTAVGTPTLTYQWQKDGQDIPGANEATLTITDVQSGDSGEYRVVVSNDIGTATSNIAKFMVIDTPPRVNNLTSTVEYYKNYLLWDLPVGQGEIWDKVIVVRKESSEPISFDDGVEIYSGIDNSLIDRIDGDGRYFYSVFTCKENGTIKVYSEPTRTVIDIPEYYNKEYLNIDMEQQNTIIGQNTSEDLYTLWNTEDFTLGKGPGGNHTNLWVYNDLIGNDENQIPAGSKVVNARLVFNVKDSSFITENEEGSANKTRSLNIYKILDPDDLGSPHYAEESGIRVGLDFNYRDHRPGMNIPWQNQEGEFNQGIPENQGNILSLLEGVKPVDILEFCPEVFRDENLDTIQFDIKEAVEAWANGEVNHGLFISTAQFWKNGEQLKLYGVSVEEDEEQGGNQSSRPYIEIIYAQSDSTVDLTPPEHVSDLNMIPGDTSITLEWSNPSDTDFAGVKIVRKEGIVPFNDQDDDFITILEATDNINNSYTDIGLTTGKTYYYAIYAFDDQHNYSQKVWIKATPGSPVVAPVLDEPVIGSGTVSLRWNQAEGATSYRIYRADNADNDSANNYNANNDIPNNYNANNDSANNDSDNNPGVLSSLSNKELIAEIKVDQSLSFTDFLLKGSYTYWIAAVNEIGEGPLSDGILVEINDDNIAADSPAAPTIFSGESISDNKVRLSWVDNSDSESSFVIERKNETDEWKEIAATVFNLIEFIDRGLKPGTVYQYRIKSVNSAGESEYTGCEVLTNGIADFSWEVISASQVKVKWKAIQNAAYKVVLLDMEGDVLEKQDLNSDYCYFVELEPDTEYRVRITAYIEGEERCSSESDIIRTSMDSKGGLFYE
ncbi:MAG: fibronectin type III domain-containing protein [Halanaerobiales bacterium]